MKAIINEGCIGCGQCEVVCPEVFRMNDDGIAVVCGDVTEELLISAEEAAEECPVAIIEID